MVWLMPFSQCFPWFPQVFFLRRNSFKAVWTHFRTQPSSFTHSNWKVSDFIYLVTWNQFRLPSSVVSSEGMGPSTPPSCLAELLTLVRSFFFFSGEAEDVNLCWIWFFCSKAQQVFTWGLLFGIGNKALEVLVMKNRSTWAISSAWWGRLAASLALLVRWFSQTLRREDWTNRQISSFRRKMDMLACGDRTYSWVIQNVDFDTF